MSQPSTLASSPGKLLPLRCYLPTTNFSLKEIAIHFSQFLHIHNIYFNIQESAEKMILFWQWDPSTATSMVQVYGLQKGLCWKRNSFGYIRWKYIGQPMNFSADLRRFNLLYMYIYSKVKLATIVEGSPKAPFSIATTPRGGRYSFPGLLYFTLDPYLIMLSVKQGGIKYHFLSLWYDATWDWTHVSRAIGEHSNP